MFKIIHTLRLIYYWKFKFNLISLARYYNADYNGSAGKPKPPRKTALATALLYMYDKYIYT